jgi:pimeloyl-ACP methyl ester carboxylesterase
MTAVFLAAALLTGSVTVDRGDYVIHAETIGQGKPMVAIAGGPGFSGRSVYGVGLATRKHLKTYLFDQLGTGKSRMKDPATSVEAKVDLYSTIADLEALRKSQGIKKWTVFGQSWGVIVALIYAAEHPGAVEHLVLTSVPGLSYDGQVLSTNLGKIIPAEVENKLIEATRKEGLTPDEQLAIGVMGVLPYYFNWPQEGIDLAAKAPTDLFSPPVFRALQKHIRSTMEYRKSLEKLPRTRFPVSMLQGHQDPCGAAMPYILRDSFLKQAKVTMLDSCGHFTWLEEYPYFTEWIYQSLKLGSLDWFEDWYKLEQPKFESELKELDRLGWPFGPASP